MRQRAYLIGLTLSATLAIAAPARAVGSVGLGFECVTQNRAGDCAIGESQLSLSLADAGSGVVRFEVANAGPERSVVSEIYFDDGALDPAFRASVGLSSQSRPSPVANGIGVGEFLAIEFTLQGGQGFQDLIDQLASGELRVGLHVIAFDSQGSESFVNVPVPEPASGALLAGGLVALAWRARSRRAQPPRP
jgi:hypothetical protein